MSAGSLENILTCNFIQTRLIVFIYLGILVEKGQEFEKEKRGICGWVWKEKRKAGNDVIIS